ncbi:hypothetical protein [Magnetospira sp. QH-2]|uniref:hypothetical protein n=1 Tax=Magnetospira sp. (strain QH-2) TaxID=1288970 RepID=UPI0003E81719|nr:hypothetical protein [Magnetospira sp. QH-2]CCQ72245.1 Putative oxidoreductases. Putative respiratory nitrate reductase 1 gamma chain [Magnetospira sp. QH-2]
MTGTELLLWAKGPGFNIALIILLFGLLLRLFEILSLGRRPDRSVPRGDARSQGMKTMWSRFFPGHGMLMLSPVVHIAGYVFHAGLFIAIFLFVPHIQLLEQVVQFAWPGLPSNVVDGVTLVTLLSMIALLVARMKDPVKKMLSGFEDYLTWVLTFLPLLTGYLAVNRLFYDYETILALHILSVELLMVLFPFTKLMHAITWAFARYYSGTIAGRKGAHS